MLGHHHAIYKEIEVEVTQTGSDLQRQEAGACGGEGMRVLPVHTFKSHIKIQDSYSACSCCSACFVMK